MSQYKISKKRLAQIIKEEYRSVQQDNRRSLNEDVNDDTFEMVDVIVQALGPEQTLEELVRAMERSTAHDLLGYIMQNHEIRTADDEVLDYDPSAFNRGEKKPDEDGDGVPDWADKKPGKDDHADKKKMKKESLDSIRNLIQQELKKL